MPRFIELTFMTSENEIGLRNVSMLIKIILEIRKKYILKIMPLMFVCE